MDGTRADAAIGSEAGVVSRRLDALCGWTGRLWAWGAAAGVLVGLVVGAVGHLLAGMTWVLLSVSAWAIRSALGAQRTEVGPTTLSVRGMVRSRSIAATEVRRIAVVHPELGCSRLVVHGHGSVGIALPIDAVAGDPALAGALRHFVAAVPRAAVVDAEVHESLDHGVRTTA